MPSLNLPRDVLAKMAGGNAYAIKQLEKAFTDIGGFPTTIDEASNLAETALAVAQMNSAMLSLLAEAIERISAAPPPIPYIEPDDAVPCVHLGTISSQNADAVEITGGTAGLDAGTATAPSLYLGSDRKTGIYHGGVDVLAFAVAASQIANFATGILSVWGNISASGQLVSNIATGAPPLVVSSVTMVPNLYASRADSANYAATAASLSSPATYPAAATDLPSAIALVNALRAAAVTKGL